MKCIECGKLVAHNVHVSLNNGELLVCLECFHKGVPNLPSLGVKGKAYNKAKEEHEAKLNERVKYFTEKYLGEEA